jgi:CBS domain-containing protein/Zn-dependent protease
LSLRIFKIAGTEVRVHFYLMLALALVLGYFEKPPSWLPGFLFAFVGCVIFHDVARIAIARRFGIRTNELILLPTGGLTTFADHPRPTADLAINVCGIMASLFLAAVFGFFSAARHELPANYFASNGAIHFTFLQTLYLANFGLALVNVLPFFPFDGSFILRAVLAFKYSERKATAMVGKLSQFGAAAMAVIGLFTLEPTLLLLALYVFSTSAHQMRAAGTRVLLKGKRVQDAMQVRFTTLESGASLESAAQEMLHGSQHDFPVVVGEEVIGVVTRIDIARGLAQFGPSGYVAGQMKRDFPRILPDAELEEAANMLSDAADIPILVMEGDSLVGLLSKEKLNEYLMLLQARLLGSRSERRSS